MAEKVSRGSADLPPGGLVLLTRAQLQELVRADLTGLDLVSELPDFRDLSRRTGIGSPTIRMVRMLGRPAHRDIRIPYGTLNR